MRDKIMTKWLPYGALVYLTVFGFSAAVVAEEYILSTDARYLRAGNEASIVITILGDGSEASEIPVRLSGFLLQQGTQLTVELETIEGGQVAALGYRQVHYRFLVPPTMQPGLAELRLDNHETSGLLVEIDHQRPEKHAMDRPSGDKDTANPVHKQEQEPVATSSAEVRLLDGLSTYKPIYFLGGIDPTDAKFQISLKYQLFNENGDWGRNNRWLRGFHLAYTQVSFWDLASESKPFEDTNFMPEVFYGLEGLTAAFLPRGGAFDLQVGFQHESNGRDGFDSRSLNVLYQRAAYRQPLGGKWFAKLTGDFWSYVGSLGDNPDIADFRGHSSFQLTAGHEQGVQLSAYRRGRLGQGKSSYLFDLTFPLTAPGVVKRLNFNLHGQLFTGYGENLLTYDQKETRFRIGLGIHR